MNIINKILSILFWGLFICLLILLSQILIIEIFPGFNKEILIYAFVAFFGAFFAFIFVKISEWILIIRKGNVNHFNSLVKIERLLDKIISRLEENILTFQNNLKALKSMKLLAWSSHAIPFSNELTDDLKNIDFINEYFIYRNGNTK
ncbi:hypothetical protein ES702_06851 [subsurface metagenome]